MKHSTVDRAYNWLVSQPRRPHHYRDDIWAALVAQYPDEFEQTAARKAPWYSIHRDMSKDERFVQGERGMFELAPEGTAERGNAPSDCEGVTEAGEDPTAPWGKTRMEQTQQWVLEALQAAGGAARLTDLIVELETTRPLTVADREPQPGHETESTFAYRCRWAVTRLRKRGLLAADSLRGEIELAKAVGPDGDADLGSFRSQRVAEWLRSMREQHELSQSDVADLLGVARSAVGHWETGRHMPNADSLRELEQLFGTDAPIVRGEEECEDGSTSDVAQLTLGGDAEPVGSWIHRTRIRLGLTQTELARQLRVTQPVVSQWELGHRAPEAPALEMLRQLSGDETPVALTGVAQRHGSIRVVDQTIAEEPGSFGGGLEGAVVHVLERADRPSLDVRAIGQRAINSGLLQGDLDARLASIRGMLSRSIKSDPRSPFVRIRHGLYCLKSRFEEFEAESLNRAEASPSEADRSAAALKAWDTRRKHSRGTSGPPAERHRRLLRHFATYGELTPSEGVCLNVAEADIDAWLDALLTTRPGGLVVSPLFLSLVEGDPSPVRFTTQLAVQLMGHHVERVVNQAIESLEDYVWQRFGAWHLAQPHPGDSKWHAYLAVPALEAGDKAASERLDLFAQLPPSVIGALVREPGFLSEQQQWSAQAAGKVNLGVLSRQLKTGARRPLFLSHFRLPELTDEPVRVRAVPESEVLARAHVVAGVALCTPREWADELVLGRDALVERLLEHPLHGAIVQLEVHRLMASLSGQIATTLRATGDGGCNVETSGSDCVPLWKTCRTLLTDIGFWPVAQSVADSYWASAVNVALANLVTLGVVERAGGTYRITDLFGSELKAHPGHPQNRGEKPFRIRLLQYLEGLQGGAR